MSNTFYITVITNRQNDEPVSIHSYLKIGPAKARRTIAKRHARGVWDAKVFKCMYALGCMSAVELDLT
jgi:hypothetical protein